MVWLREQGYGVHAYCADLGQDEDFAAARAKALKIGAKSVHIEDLREEFLNTYILPAIQANAIYENLYLMGTSLARPCIAKRAVEIAHKMGCGFVAHGATGKGNDQVRFELTFAALDPALQAIVPWRDPAFFNKFQGRGDLLEYAAKHGVPVVQTKAKPYSCVLGAARAFPCPRAAALRATLRPPALHLTPTTAPHLSTPLLPSAPPRPPRPVPLPQHGREHDARVLRGRRA